MTYATDLFTGDGSTVEFTLTFDFIQRDHVKVYRVVTATEAETELTVLTSGDPSGDQYAWESNTQIKVGTAPTSDQQIKVVRNTPKDEQLVDWTDGSYIVAADLNTADRQFLYDIQELEDQIEEIDGSSTGGAAVKGVTGTAPITVDNTDPQNPIIGSDAITEITGTSPISVDLTDPQKPEISSSAVTEVTGVSPISVDLTDPQKPEISSSAVTAVTGTTPVSIDNSNPQQPDVSVDAITKAQAESDPTNPSWDTDDKLASAGAIDRVFKQVVGDGVGFPGSGNKAKDGQLRVDNTGTEPDLYYWDASLGTPAWVEIAQTGPTGPKGDKGDTGDTGPAPGLQSPPAAATSVALNSDGSVGTPTVSVTKDSSDDLKFDFGIPIGQKGDKGDTGSGVTYKGLIDAVTAAEPTNPDNGDFYVSSAAGTSSWAGTVLIGSRIVYNGNTSSWDTYDPVASQTLQQVCDLDNFTTTDIAIGNTSSSPKIELKNDGSAIYQAGIQADGITLNTGGSASAGLYVRGASSANVAKILGDGDAEFTGDVEVDGSITADGAITGQLQSEYALRVTNGGDVRGGLWNHADGLQLYLVDDEDAVQVELDGTDGSATFEGRLEAGQGSFNADVGIIGESGTDTAFFIRDAGQTGSPTTFSVKADGTTEAAAGGVNIFPNGADQGGMKLRQDNDANTVFAITNGTNNISTTSQRVLIKGNGNIAAKGNLLVGPSTTTTSYYRAIFEGNTNTGAGGGDILLSRNATTPSDNQALGTLAFGDDTHVAGAVIQCTRSGATWSSSSKPTKIAFSTCSNGSNTVTERLAINSDGSATFTGDTYIEANLLIKGGNGSGVFIRNKEDTKYTIDLNEDGSIDAAGKFTCGEDITSSGKAIEVNTEDGFDRFVVFGDGSITAAGSCSFSGGNGLTTDHSVGIRASGSGLLDLRRDDTDQAIGVYNGGDSAADVTFKVTGNGNIECNSITADSQLTVENNVTINDGVLKVERNAAGSNDLITFHGSSGQTGSISVGGQANFSSVKFPDGTTQSTAASSVLFSWGSVSDGGDLLAGSNIDDVSYQSTGTYAVTFETAMSSANYAVLAVITDDYGCFTMIQNKATTGFTVKTVGGSGSTSNKAFDFQVNGN